MNHDQKDPYGLKNFRFIKKFTIIQLMGILITVSLLIIGLVSYL